MQPLEALVFELLRLLRGLRIEHGCARHVALLQAHGLAVLEVDGGE